ncbi:nuclear transport factor 2 family protein [Chryseobacterium sp. RP-3-3]|uniref:Nuclear transport factor 2 family protein n=1 Tax=Chryseobacterium antibioticum TaxID=2728847 RepID=A0A7Y0AL03_9FLAO|nr:nuclear transport factor 2 family protein [Chryseobacterium antibioticum]NML69199.1 nuclear transport factor 2 family protein [Chryseobacterium antibioticum]
METMPLNEIRKNKIETYFNKIDSGTFDDEYFGLYTEDVEMYYPKFGFEKGKQGIKNFGKVIGKHLEKLTHDMQNFRYIFSDPIIVVEGNEKGITRSGKEWPDYTTSFGKFCNVFEFDGELIKRVHIYVDPDFTSEDTERLTIFRNESQSVIENPVPQTKDVVEEFYDIQFGRKEGNIMNLFADDVDWDLPGNEEKFPWTGKRQTKQEIGQFFQELHNNVTSESFNIDFISVKGENATVVGQLSSKILKYNKVFSTEFVVIFKVVDGKIVKYHFLEDSYALNEEMN